MLYEIKGKYYILVGNKYVNVTVLPSGKDDITLKPNMNEFIERSIHVDANVVNVDDNFKKRFTRGSKSSLDSDSRYNR